MLDEEFVLKSKYKQNLNTKCWTEVIIFMQISCLQRH